MADQFLPRRFDDGAVANRAGSAPIPHTAVAFEPGALHMSPADRTTDECWDLLSLKVRRRIAEMAGPIIDRWAYTDLTDRVCATVLGERGLVTVNPTRGTSGGHASAVRLFPARPGSVRSARIEADTTAERYRTSSATHGPATTGPVTSGPAPLAAHLPADFTAFLGNLPERTQLLLQDPFIATAAEVRCDHYYTETVPAGGRGARTLRVWCYLTDRSRVTFGSGNGMTYGSSFQSAVWQLTCWRFDVGRPEPTVQVRR